MPVIDYMFSMSKGIVLHAMLPPVHHVTQDTEAIKVWKYVISATLKSRYHISRTIFLMAKHIKSSNIEHMSIKERIIFGSDDALMKTKKELLKC
ncbi:MAG: hypothetical protein RBT65_09530 [Methanolobus sp.]|nr:hypothetical protein [Methanolobus sp.]